MPEPSPELPRERAPGAAPPTLAVAAAVVLGGLPVGVFGILNVLRPDLMQPMLGNAFGAVVTLVEAALTIVGLAVQLVAVYAVRDSPGLRLTLVIVAVLLCTVPALFLVLFAPIVFAMLFGGGGGA